MLSTFGKIRETRRYISNWHEVILYGLGITKSMNIHFRNLSEGGKAYAEPVRVSSKDRSMRINYKGKEVVFYYDRLEQLSNSGMLMRVEFLDEEYKRLNPKGETVIDIGANIADSAIYFALEGAEKVYAFEPYPYSCGIARRNIAANNLESKIVLFNEACAGTRGVMKIDPKLFNNGATSLEGTEQGDSVNIATLDEIINRLGISSYLLKMDCEGCEVGIFANVTQPTLEKCKRMIIEYHDGNPAPILEKLKSVGFRTEVRKDGDVLGIIFAEK
jgi:FkbM family methyltransferase